MTLSKWTLESGLFDKSKLTLPFSTEFKPRGVRKTILKRKLNKSPKRDHLEVDLDLIVKNFNFGDWKLLYHLLR